MKHFFYLLLMVIVVSSCQDEFSETSLIIPEIPGPTIRVEADVLGRVFDENGQALQGVEVDFAGQTNPSNSNGFFLFESANASRFGEVITLEREGFFPAIRRIDPIAGSVNTTDFQLLSNLPTHQFSSSESFTINLDEGLTLVFPPDAVATQNGDLFAGSVNVALHFIDPTAEDINELLPGSLQGVTFEQELVTLLSYGMLVAELTDDAGAELQVRDGQTVRWIQTIPASLSSSAPDQVPLWSLDETTGLWIEEGVSIKQGDTYVSELSHFSYWNIDDPNDFVVIEGSVDAPFAIIQFVDSNGETRQRKQADANGGFTAYIPKDENITLIFLDECGDEIGQTEVGPFNENMNIGELDFTSDVDEVNLTATLFDCNGDLLETGFLLINNHIYLYVENGQVDEGIIICDEQEISIVGFNSDFTLTSEPVILQLENDIDAGDLSICDENDTSADFVNILITNSVTNEEMRFVFSDIVTSFCGGSIDTPPTTQVEQVGNLSFISNRREAEEDGFQITLEHIDGCDTPVSDINIEVFVLEIINEVNPELFIAENFGGQRNIEGSLVSYGENPGDVIKGAFTSTMVFRLDFAEGTEEDNYTISVDFQLTVK